ncbi:MAG TPA: hypothetical protein VFQ91_02910 [Bryobacteraceae bacterium]|nr:hypothetical protein [Bryobacteraceae bacterium]
MNVRRLTDGVAMDLGKIMWAFVTTRVTVLFIASANAVLKSTVLGLAGWVGLAAVYIALETLPSLDAH